MSDKDRRMAKTARKSDNGKRGMRVSVRVPDALGRRIERIALKNGISGSDVVRMALNQHLDAMGKAAA